MAHVHKINLLPSLKLTWPLKIGHPKRKLVYYNYIQLSIFVAMLVSGMVYHLLTNMHMNDNLLTTSPGGVLGGGLVHTLAWELKSTHPMPL